MSDRLFDIMTDLIERTAKEQGISFKDALEHLVNKRDPLFSLPEYHEILVQQRERHHQEIIVRLDKFIAILEAALIGQPKPNHR